VPSAPRTHGNLKEELSLSTLRGACFAQRTMLLCYKSKPMALPMLWVTAIHNIPHWSCPATDHQQT
jgi:hypothetical protein